MSELQIKKASIAYRFNSPYPFDDSLLLDKLTEEDHFVKREETLKIGSADIGHVENFYSQSGKSVLNLQPHEGIFGIKSTDYEECKLLFGFLQKVIFEKIGAEKDEVKYLEFVCRGLFKQKKHPLDVIESKFSVNTLTISSDSFKTFGIRLFSTDSEVKGMIKSIQYWSDFRLEPFVLNPTLMLWDWVYRNTEEKTLENWGNLSTIIQGILTAEEE